jgi:hypothetical protein
MKAVGGLIRMEKRRENTGRMNACLRDLQVIQKQVILFSLFLIFYSRGATG